MSEEKEEGPITTGELDKPFDEREEGFSSIDVTTWHANPTEPVFWFMMQIGMTIGFFTSYPANIWLVKKGIKHGM